MISWPLASFSNLTLDSALYSTDKKLTFEASVVLDLVP
jgi:hypothetical protein